jgi:hypothetical protein
MTGTKVVRDERQQWGEYDFGFFRLRATDGEAWEINSDTTLVPQYPFSRHQLAISMRRANQTLGKPLMY